MKAHFIASTLNLNGEAASFQKIINAITATGVTLTSEWFQEAKIRASGSKNGGDSDEIWQDIYRQNLDAITRSDIVIAEVSSKSFLVGFQVAYALQMKKPILLLGKHRKADSALGVSSHEEIVQFEEYDDNNIDKIIKTFVNENIKGGKDIRFNFFIDKKILNYLNWAALKTGQTKSEIIRGLLEKEIKRTGFK